MQAVLVGIDADAELAGVGGRLQHADAGAAGRVVDDVGAAVDLALGELAALDRVVPGGAASCRSCSGTPRRPSWRALTPCT